MAKEKDKDKPARDMVRIRAKVDHLTTLNATLMKDHVGECPTDRAKYLIGKGLADIAEGEIEIPNVGTVAAVKGDHTERATSRKAEGAEHQTRKG